MKQNRFRLPRCESRRFGPAAGADLATGRHRRRSAAALVIAVLLSTAGCSANDGAKTNEPIIDVTAGGDVTSSDSTQTEQPNNSGQRTFFDHSTVGSIEVTFDQDEFDKMLEAFIETGEKGWIAANVTIDGVAYRQAGMRLKGNSSLFGLMSAGAVEASGGSDGEGLGDLVEIDPACLGETMPVSTTDGQTDPVDPASLTWMIRLDKFVEDQAHQGRTRFAVRGSNDPIPLVEALALDLLGRSGLASQRFTMVRFGVNGGDEQLRLVAEVPDDRWMQDAFGPGGVLYKADSTGNYDYRGEDPDDYDGVWSQDGGEEDLGPLIKFLEFIDESTDAEFVEQLDEHIDVEAFARYLAFQELILNDDDITGPGNNSYLHVDADGRATVVAWDHNLAFAGATSDSAGSMIGVATGEPDDGAPVEGAPVDGGGVELPEGCELPDTPTEAPDDTTGTGTDPDQPVDPGPVVPYAPSNPLVERFLDTPELEAMVDEARKELRAELFDSGVAQDALESLVATIRRDATDLADDDSIDDLVAAITMLFPKD